MDKEGKAASALESLRFDENLYPHKATDKKLEWPPPEAEDDRADDIQPRYEFSGIVDNPETKKEMFLGEVKTAVNHRGQLILNMKCTVYREDGKAHGDVPLRGYLLDGSMLSCNGTRIAEARAELHRDKPPVALARFRTRSLILKRRGHHNIKTLRERIQSVCIPLYNCLLPHHCSATDLVAQPGMPQHDGYPIHFTWQDWDVVIGQFAGIENRLKALEAGATAVPTCFLWISKLDESQDLTALTPSHPEIRRLLAAFALGTLATPHIRFWEYLDKSGDTLARIHAFSPVPNWESYSTLIPHRTYLGRFLEAASQCDETREYWWGCAIGHLIASCFIRDASIGGLHGPFTYISIAADTLTEAKGLRRGCGGGIIYMEKRLNIGLHAEDGSKKEAFCKLWSKRRKAAIHGAAACRREPHRSEQTDRGRLPADSSRHPSLPQRFLHARRPTGLRHKRARGGRRLHRADGEGWREAVVLGCRLQHLSC